MDLKEEDILGDAIAEHWYYVSKARALKRAISGLERGSILDVGAGSGIFSKVLLEDGFAASTCVDPNYDVEREESHAGKPLRFVKGVEASDAGLVLMMDVCEHVPDDAALIRQYADVVAPGAHFLITVPAFQFLFSAHDVFLEHYRRYTVASLEEAVRKAGLEVVRSHYYFAGIFPIAAAQRLYEKRILKQDPTLARSSLKRHSPVVNSALKALCAVELPVMKLNRAFGLSAFCLARKAL